MLSIFLAFLMHLAASGSLAPADSTGGPMTVVTSSDSTGGPMTAATPADSTGGPMKPADSTGGPMH